MTQFRLVPVRPKQPTAELEILHGDPPAGRQDLSVPVIGFEPGKATKYLVSIEVGDLSPSEAMGYLRAAQEQLKPFFGENLFVLVPSRNSHPSMAVYEIQPVEEP